MEKNNRTIQGFTMRNKIPVIITTLPISTPAEEAYECIIDDKGLIGAICEYRSMLEKDGVEVFSRNKNIIATEKGWFFAFYESDIQTIEDEHKVKPFIGEDGRLKVVLLNDKGLPEIKDLATLVAETFVPNPNGYNKVGFKNNDSSDCNSTNLTWHE